MFLRLLDTTLRDGLQTPGVAIGRAAKVAIAKAITSAMETDISEPFINTAPPADLARTNTLPRIETEHPQSKFSFLLEAGIPASGPEAADDIAAIADAIGPSLVVAWCRATPSDLATAAATPAGHVHLSFPVSEIHLGAWRRDYNWVFENLSALLPAARARFMTVSIGAQDASRADPAFLADFAAASRQLGVDRLRICDTAGVWTPARAAAAIARLRDIAPPLSFHAHNDLGLATANTLAALEAGAAWAEVTVNGLGERAGNAALEEVEMAWLATNSSTTKNEKEVIPRVPIRPAALGSLSDTVARLVHRPVAPNKPIVGSVVFTHESGIHCAGILRDPRTYEALSPETVGRQRPAFLVGQQSGRAAIRATLERLDVINGTHKVDEVMMESLLSNVRCRSRELGRSLTDSELKDLAQKHIK